MVRAALLALVLSGACTSEVGRTDEESSSACDPSKDELIGCCAAGASCTWAAPTGSRCTDDYTSFCDHGLGWCEDSVCRVFCSPVSIPRCEAGLIEQHEPAPELGEADRCLCVPG